MRDAIIGLLPVIDQALADSVGVIDERALEPVAHLRNRTLTRLAYPDDVLLTALAGGTGSGKSSLFNAVAGEEVATTGGVRPTTSRPQVLVPIARRTALAGYLDEIGVDERVAHDGHDWLCLIDLPDTDSVEVEHRLRVDSLLPRLDCVIWVVDPEKYRDAALHHAYLAPMAAYQSQFVFVLNQADRLTDDEITLVKADLVSVLEEDGIEAPTVLATRARPPAGPSVGIDELLEVLHQKLGGSVYEKLLVDLRAGCALLLAATGGGSGPNFDARWEEVLDQAGAQADAGDLSGAGQQVAAFLEIVADETGGELGSSIGEIAGRAPAVVLGGGSSPAQSVDLAPRRRWWGRRVTIPPIPVAVTGSALVRTALATEVGDPVRKLLARKARAQAAILALALALNELPE
jgi:hypothetical protein